jgi:hypothetical protein
MSRAGRIGATVAVLYVAAVALTAAFTNRTVRPLFDAIGPPPAYRWVKPPPDFATGNVKPEPVKVAFGLKPEDPPPGGASEDSQFVFNLPRDAIPRQGDAKAVATITPLDPDTLGPLPPKTFADGNAYRIQFNYDPGEAVAPVNATGSVLLTVPIPADGVVFSSDGKTWKPVTNKSAGATAIGADMQAAGYFLATTPDVIAISHKGGIGRLAVPIAITVVLAGALVAVPLLLRRRSEAPARPIPRQQQRQRARQRQRQRQRRRR